MQVIVTPKTWSTDRFKDDELGVRCLGLLSYLAHLAGPLLPPHSRSIGVDIELVFARFPGSKADDLRALMFILIDNGYLEVFHDGAY